MCCTNFISFADELPWVQDKAISRCALRVLQLSLVSEHSLRNGQHRITTNAGERWPFWPSFREDYTVPKACILMMVPL